MGGVGLPGANLGLDQPDWAAWDTEYGKGDKYSLTLPGEIETLAGSCVLIPCNFTLPENCKINSSRFIRAIWIKGGKHTNNKVVFNSTHNTNIGFERIEIRGNLHQQNCTTIFYNVKSNHTGHYYFRVETPAFKYTFDDFLNLMVKVSPEVVEASVSPSGAVAESSSVTLTCNSSEANPPVHNYTWFRDTQTSPVGSGPNITFNVSSSHAGLYYCRAEHLLRGEESNKVKLRVEDSGSFLIYMMAAGGCLGVLLLCVVTGFVLRIKKSKVTEQDNQNPIPQDSDVHDKGGPAHTNAPNPIKDKQEEIHYGEISFSRPPLRDRSEGTGQQGLGQAPESEYAEVLLPGGDGQARYQKAPDAEELYAQVKCK
ncbi:hypothetical protein ACEWY4_018804 [Coilia grayii]|uniref:Ig-like domain-containing protein n=1 Tax=Coilia grayii TaxID=363190 RepID=A0ABD1JEI6_9TELE